jgi:hypothetical protein
MLQALLQGDLPPAALAELARGRMRSKREQLVQARTSQLKPHHRFLIAEHLAPIDTLEEAIERESRRNC